MSLRAVWIISTETRLPLFTRCFPTVEERCKSMSKDANAYVCIPPEKEFARLMLTELGINNSDVYVESRDRCDKPTTLPTLELQTESGSLWPIVTMKNQDLIYCALPLISETPHHPTTELAIVSTSLRVLEGLAKCVHAESISPTKGVTSELIQYVTVSLPFGRPVFCDPLLAGHLLNPSSKGKAKQPLWNPAAHKGKSQLNIHITEEVHSIQFNRTETRDILLVGGAVSCHANVEGICPELGLTLTGSKQVSVGPSVSSVEQKGSIVKLRFHPHDSQPLCLYTPEGTTEPPVHGSFNFVWVSERLAVVYVQLQLKVGVRNSFQHLEVQIPLSGTWTVLRSDTSSGTATLRKEGLVWGPGSKLPVSLRVRMQTATVQVPHAGPQYAQVEFRISDYTYSGTKVDPQSVTLSTAAKVRCSIGYELKSGKYQLWNTEGPSPAEETSAEAIENLLKEVPT